MSRNISLDPIDISRTVSNMPENAAESLSIIIDDAVDVIDISPAIHNITDNNFQQTFGNSIQSFAPSTAINQSQMRYPNFPTVESRGSQIANIPNVPHISHISPQIPRELQSIRREPQSVQQQNTIDTHATNASDISYTDISRRLRDKVIVYEYMCNRTSRMYGKYDWIMIFILTVFSAILVLLNSNMTQFAEVMTIINIAGNSINAFVIVIKTLTKFGEKADYFKNTKGKFTDLHNKLNSGLLNKTMTPHSLDIFMKDYDHLDTNMTYEVPDSILNEVRTKFEGCALPTICNGIEIIDTNSSLRNKNTQRKKYTIPDIV